MTSLTSESAPQPISFAPPVVLGASVAVGVVAAVALPFDRPGIGWFLVALASTAALLVVGRKAAASDRKRNLGWAVLALALVAVGTFRDARWLFTLCVLTACVAGSLAVAGGKSSVDLLRGAFAVPLGAVSRLGWFRRGFGKVRPSGNARTIAAAGVSLVLLVVFGALFAGADATFAKFISSAMPTVDGSTTFTSVFLYLVFSVTTAGACWVLTQPRREFSLPDKHISLRRIEWLMPISVLVLLFAAFASIQLPALFGLAGDVPTVTGLSYAEYARRGFWQLLVVAVLTLAIIAAVTRWAPKESSADRAWLRALLGVLSVLSLVIVASAIARMWIYQQVYGFTVLRVLVMACEVWLGVVYLLVLAAGIRLRGSWLPGTVLATAMVTLLGLAVLNPDRFIADGNITRYQQTQRLDMHYLFRLSTDVTPALARLPEKHYRCLLGMNTSNHRLMSDDWRSWNLSRSAALKARKELVDGSLYCVDVPLQRN